MMIIWQLYVFSVARAPGVTCMAKGTTCGLNRLNASPLDPKPLPPR